jgi:pimeloyl-ACP methyl ester carboxylesterase
MLSDLWGQNCDAGSDRVAGNGCCVGRRSPARLCRVRGTVGKPVFCFDGWPSSRWGALLKDAEAKAAGVRLIGVDRPGMGLSDYEPNRRLLDWPSDVEALSNSLGLDRWAVWGISGGVPFALACARQLPDRVSACGVVSGAAPRELAMREFVPAFRWQFALARRLPWLIRPLLWHRTGRHYMKDYETARGAHKSGLEDAAEPDRAFKDDPGNALTVHMIREAFRQGMRGPSFEGRLLVQDWGFRLEDVTHEHVYLWHSDKDIQAPAAAARVVAERIPNCEATFFPGEAHASAVVHHTEEMLRTLAQR